MKNYIVDFNFPRVKNHIPRKEHHIPGTLHEEKKEHVETRVILVRHKKKILKKKSLTKCNSRRNSSFIK
jgi:hypothetical protein